jgi:hypothetical protein
MRRCLAAPSRRATPAPAPGRRRPPARWRALLAVAAAASALGGCAGTPPPDWALDAHGAMRATLAAALRGDARLEAAEYARATAALARTGRTDLLARAALMRCAAHVAALDFGPCADFEPRRVDAAAADRAYADLLAGRLVEADAASLPASQQAVRRGGEAALAGVDDPLARLVGAATLLQAGRAGPATVATAVDTASAQGWRRPLLAWLGVQRQLADAAGDRDEAARLQRRIDAALAGAAGSTRAPAAR